jgi:hypothetical protein
MIKHVVDGDYGDMGLYALLQQMFGHKVAAKICVVDGIPYATDEQKFHLCPKIPDPFKFILNDFNDAHNPAGIIDGIPDDISTFISPICPKPLYLTLPHGSSWSLPLVSM